MEPVFDKSKGLQGLAFILSAKNNKRTVPLLTRVVKPRFSKKYYSSVLNLRDFLAENIGQSFVGVIAKSIDDNYRRYNH